MTAERAAQREREQWFGFLSHDLRGPQVTILSLLALYAENAPDMSIRRLLDGVESEARRTIDLAEDFMDMVEAESGVYRFSTTSPVRLCWMQSMPPGALPGHAA